MSASDELQQAWRRADEYRRAKIAAWDEIAVLQRRVAELEHALDVLGRPTGMGANELCAMIARAEQCL